MSEYIELFRQQGAIFNNKAGVHVYTASEEQITAYSEALRAKDKEEIARLKNIVAMFERIGYDRLDESAKTESALKTVREQLSEANVVIAIKDEALKQNMECLHDIATDQNGWAWEEVISQSQVALSTTPESLAAWEAEKLLPLRREVAMLRETVDAVFVEVRLGILTLATAAKLKLVLSDTQATAEAYDREHAAKVQNDAAHKLRGTGYDATLKHMAEELLAPKGKESK